MKFCLRNESLRHPLIPGGVSECFLETVASSVLLGFICLCGIPSLVILFRKRANQSRKMKNIFYKALWLFMNLMMVLTLTRFILQAKVLYKTILTGYMVLAFCAYFLGEFIALALLMTERKWSVHQKHSLALIGFWILQFVNQNLALSSFGSSVWWWPLINYSDKIEFGLWVSRYVLSFFILVLGLAAPGLKSPNQTFSRYMSIQSGDIDAEGRTRSSNSTWSNISSKAKLVFEATWPRDSYILQLKVLICIVIIIVGRVANLFTPITYKYVIDSLTLSPRPPGPNSSAVHLASTFEQYSQHSPISLVLLDPGKFIRVALTALVFRWDLLLIYGALRILQGSGIGSGGLLSGMRTQLWITVQQYSSRKIGVHLFAHLHSLSLTWHMSKKTGEILRIMDRGVDSMQSLLNMLLFNISPTVVDIFIGVVYFASAFNFYFALIVFVTMVLYFASTIIVTEWRTKYRRNMNKLDNAKSAKAVDSLLNFETVKYYGAENYEVENYHQAIIEYQKADWLSQTTLNMLNLIQNFVINLGFIGGAMLCAHYIVDDGSFTVGDFVLYCTYIVQLNAPLNFFGTYYRMIQQNFIDMENMFDLLDINQDVKDTEDAVPLKVTHGEIEFRNVCFSYKAEKQILKNVSFKIPSGQTFALVGNSGGGKSTIIRLLFRFYDVDSGEILIDGQPIHLITQQSLRQSIGVVPQDTVLFNQSIRENIRYGNLNATDEQIEEAARAADIHDRILNFPDQYNTLVGERGLKLSGGEKQRVAIARTLLKSPRIVLLDEATSALDTATERNIQASLNKISVNRTCISVAHRLSTIVDSDQILVIQEGEIKERGTHSQLVNLPDGIYGNLWRQQLSVNDPNGSKENESSNESSNDNSSKPKDPHGDSTNLVDL